MKPSISIGANLGELSFYSRSLVTCDLMKLSEQWTAYFNNGEQVKGYPFKQDEFGNILELPDNAIAGTFLSWGIENEYPTGIYIITYQGDGVINPNNTNVTIVSSRPGRILINKTVADNEGIFIGIERTNPADPIRNISVRWHGHRQSGIFQPKFLSSTKFPCLRFMDFGMTNEIHDSPITEFEQLGKINNRSWALGAGMPLKVMIDLCNLQRSDFWYCIPHAMSNKGIQRIASFIAENLDPSLKAYIEYSNEWWNDGFPQNEYFYNMGKARFLRLPVESRFDDLFYGRRACVVMNLCRQQFDKNGTTNRFYPVLSVQTGAPGREQYLFDSIPKGKEASDFFRCYAIAPYLGYTLGNGSELTWPTVEQWLKLPQKQALDSVFEFLLEAKHLGRESSVPGLIEQMDYHAKVAKEHGLTLVAYEGGSHTNGKGDIANNEQFNTLSNAANRDPRMGVCLDKIFEHWYVLNAGVFCYFNAPVGVWTKWGPWALRESYMQTTPKFDAVMRWSKQ